MANNRYRIPCTGRSIFHHILPPASNPDFLRSNKYKIMNERPNNAAGMDDNFKFLRDKFFAQKAIKSLIPKHPIKKAIVLFIYNTFRKSIFIL